MPVSTSPHPAPTIGRTVWAGGRLHSDNEPATVAVTDHGLVVGDGVFEALKILPAGPFAIQRHLDRLSRSAAALGLPAPDHTAVRAAIDAVAADRRYPYGKVRITYTSGDGPLGSQAAYGPTTLVVIAEPLELPPPTTSILTVPWTRNERGALAGVKSTSYAENVRALAHAVQRGAGEAIFANTMGQLCEGTGTNIFCVFGDRVVTPPLSSGPLAGVTRELLLEWSDVDEADLTVAQAQEADEVFITSSLRDVQAVTGWDGRTFAAPGPVTRMLSAVFAARSSEHLDP